MMRMLLKYEKDGLQSSQQIVMLDTECKEKLNPELQKWLALIRRSPSLLKEGTVKLYDGWRYEIQHMDGPLFALEQTYFRTIMATSMLEAVTVKRRFIRQNEWWYLIHSEVLSPETSRGLTTHLKENNLLAYLTEPVPLDEFVAA